jgi:hypothetical protein
MKQPWWQRLTNAKPQTPKPKSHPRGRAWDLGFEVCDYASGGWWLQAESKPVKVGLIAAARPVPALLTAWTFNSPMPLERPLPRGADRLALLHKWGLTV